MLENLNRLIKEAYITTTKHLVTVEVELKNPAYSNLFLKNIYRDNGKFETGDGSIKVLKIRGTDGKIVTLDLEVLMDYSDSYYGSNPQAFAEKMIKEFDKGDLVQKVKATSATRV